MVAYDFGELDELIPAYAMSIHKSQGSEYPVVVIPVHTQHYTMLQRNLLYTGVTRGKRLVVLVGTERAVAIAVKRADAQRRYSGLEWRLARSTRISFGFEKRQETPIVETNREQTRTERSVSAHGSDSHG